MGGYRCTNLGPVSGGPGATQVLVVDDHLVVAETLRMAIDLEDGLECVGIAGTVNEAMDILGHHSTDVVLMDVRLPGTDGIEGTRQMKARHPSVRVVIVSAYTDLDIVARAAGAGASGVLTKEGALADVMSAIRTANDGALLVDTLALSHLAPGEPGPQPATADRGLTRREREILLLMGEGLNPKSIATRLGITFETVRGHLKSIMVKLDAHTQLEAVMIAVREGIVSPSSP